MAKKYSITKGNRHAWPLSIRAGTVIFTLIILGFLVYTIQFKDNSPGFSSATVASPSGDAKKQLFRIRIPKINLDRGVVEVGLDAKGDMETPGTPDIAGWYNKGPLPGRFGSAVVTGHYGWSGNTPAIFDNLYQMEPGDRIFIDDKTGSKSFIVRQKRSYHPQDKVPEVFTRRGGQYLNLITCQGKWNETDKSYDKRLVVFAELEL